MRDSRFMEKRKKKCPEGGAGTDARPREEFPPFDNGRRRKTWTSASFEEGAQGERDISIDHTKGQGFCSSRAVVEKGARGKRVHFPAFFPKDPPFPRMEIEGREELKAYEGNRNFADPLNHLLKLFEKGGELRVKEKNGLIFHQHGRGKKNSNPHL